MAWMEHGLQISLERHFRCKLKRWLGSLARYTLWPRWPTLTAFRDGDP